VIATATNTVVATISLTFVCECSSQPAGVAITPDGSRVYVTDVGQNVIEVISTATNTVIFPSTTEGDVSSLNGPIAITPDGSAAFYTFGTGSVGRFDTSTNNHTATLTVGSTPAGIAVTPNGAFIYVANTGNSTVSVIPNTPNAVLPAMPFNPITTISLPEGSAPSSIAITPDGKLAYVVNENGTFSVISTALNTVTTTGSLPATPLDQIAITSDGSQAYVADSEIGEVDVIITASNMLLATPISTGPNSSPFGVAASGSQTKTLGPPGTTTIFTFNTDTYKITGVTDTGGEQVTVEAFLVPASQFPTLTGFPNEKCIPYGDYSSGGVDTCVEFQVHCQISATDTTPCNFIYLVATGFDLPADLSGGIGGVDFLVAHGVDCRLTSTSVLQSIFLAYEATIKDPTIRGGSRGPSCFVGTYTPGAAPITTGTSTRLVGWGSPVVNSDLNQVKAGSTRPLSFQFFDTLGNPVTNLSLCNSFATMNGVNVCNDVPAVPTPWVNIASYAVACPNGPAVNATTDSTADFAGNSGLQNLGAGNYQLNWKTQKSWKGSCANVVVTFDSTLTVVPAVQGFQFN